MNGKIKTKFAALFAVALMITVCVVPMVGGSEDVEAADPGVTISGTVVDATGTSIGDVKVYVDGTDLYSIKTDGTFSISNVPKGKVVLKVDTTTESFDGVDNDAYGQTFPVITLDNVTGDESNIKFVAGMATVSGNLALKGSGVVKIKDVSISGAEGTVKTDADGNFSFLGYVGKKYSLSASAVSTTFKAEVTLAPAGNSGVALEAQDYLIYGTASAPFGSISVKPAASNAVNSITGVSSTVFNIDSTGTINVYTKPVLNTANNTSATTLLMTFGYGIDVVDQTISLAGTATSPAVISSNFSANFIADNAFVIKATVGGIAVPIDSAKLYGYAADDAPATGENTTLRTINANVVDGIGYVGDVYNYNITGTRADGTTAKDGVITTAKIIPSYKAYEFTELTKATATFAANNAKSVTVSAPAGTIFAVTATDAVVSDDEFITGASNNLTFFVPYGTSVSVTAPANFSPSTQTVSAVYADYTFETFTYDATITYTGQIFLNGVPVKENISYSVNGKNGSYVSVPDSIDSSGCGWIWEKETGWIYKLSVVRSIEASEIFIKVGQTAGGTVVPPTFQYNVDAEGKFVPVGITNGKFADIDVKKQDVTATVADGDLAIPGMEVEFQMLLMNDPSDTAYNKNKVVAELGKATTDAKGVAKISAAWSGSPIYKIFAVPGGESDFGTYEVSKIIVEYNSTSNKMNASVGLNGQTIYGFYTADASAISGLEISYIEYNYNDLVGSSKATIIDNMYYIVLSDGNNVVMSVDSVKYNEISSTPVYAGHKDIKVVIKEDVKAVSVILMDNEYSDFVTIQKPTNPEKGQVVVLSAEKTCYKLNDGTFGYQYADAAVEYKFAGWYVNGKLLTEDCDTAITLSEDVVIVAQYDEAVKVIGSQDVPEAGLDTNVLILGIVVVVIALIAVVYSVISKRD